MCFAVADTDGGDDSSILRRSRPGDCVRFRSTLIGTVNNEHGRVAATTTQAAWMSAAREYDRSSDGSKAGVQLDDGGFDVRLPFVFCIGSDAEQVVNTFESDWRDNPELSKVRSDRIDHRVRRRMNGSRVRCNLKQLCSSAVLAARNRVFGRVT
jgi:hypothetical protein